MSQDSTPEGPGAAEPRATLLAVLLVLACLFGLFSRCLALRRAPDNFDGIYGMVAWNNLKYGFADGGLAQIVTPGPPVPRSERVQYQTHLPLGPILSSLSLAVFGHSLWAARLPHLLCGVAAVLVIALIARRLYGWRAAALAAIVGALVPVACLYGGPFLATNGSVLVLAVALAVWQYLRYSDRRRWRDLLLFYAAVGLGLWADWPAYLLPWVLGAHALLYGGRAERRAMVLPVAATVVCFAAYCAYAFSIPPERQLYHSLRQSVLNWTVADSEPGKDPSAHEGPASGSSVYAQEMSRRADPSAKQFAVVVGKRSLELYSPIVVLAALWMALRAPRALRTRRRHRDQLPLLFWLWPLPFVGVFYRSFFTHANHMLFFLPAVVLTAAAMASWLLERRRRVLSLALLGVACVLLAQWSYMVLGEQLREDDELRTRYAAWSADLARETQSGREAALPLHYAQQMRFLADRRVRENIDSEAAVAKLEALGGDAPHPLFVPLAYPVGHAGFGGWLLTRYSARRATSTVIFNIGAPRPAHTVRLQNLGPADLGEDVLLTSGEFALFPTSDGASVLYFGCGLTRAPALQPGDRLEWQFRFVLHSGRPLQVVSAPARSSASYFVAVPAGWSAASDRVEVELRYLSKDARSVGLATRLKRKALQLLTFRRLGKHKPVTRRFPVDGEAPLVLSGFAHEASGELGSAPPGGANTARGTTRP